MGQDEALVDRMPGLTRDRREGVSELFPLPVRIVDTAGFEDIENLDEPEARSINGKMMEDMIVQTRNALIYSDLAIFIVDAREGIQHHDIALHKWIMERKFLEEKRNQYEIETQKPLNPEIIYEKPLKDYTSKKEYKKELELYELQKSEQQMKRKEVIFRSQFRNPLEEADPEGIKIPKIIYVANKAEDENEGDINSEIWQLDQDDILFVSAMHGDGMQDLFGKIISNIPEEKHEEYERRRALRIQRYNEYKEMMMQELEQLRMINMHETESLDVDFNPKELANEFDFLNPDPEYNSDFDSDNEVNPLDTLTQVGKPTSIRGISTENMMKKKPIQLSVIGRPNVGKSTIVNGLLREDRVIANDLPGTTRDAISIQWVHMGRRVNLVDTAGVDIKARNKNRIEHLINENMEKVLKYSHIAIVLIDAMEAFTIQDLMIMDKVISEGRGLVVAANKWDLVADKYKRKAVQWMNKQLEKKFRQAKGIPLTFVSAKTGIRVDKVMDEVLRVYEKWNTRISTSLLNNWLTALKRVHKMPGEDGRFLNIRYIMQIKSRPPTFFIFVNDTRLVFEVYKRFLRNTLIKEFGFEGVPVRLLFRDNRYMYQNRNPLDIPHSQRTIMKRIELNRRQQMNSVTFRRRLAGNQFLYYKKGVFGKSRKRV
ncbi:unnamed protein product [Moneuplotes crassus]|uniref:GTPase Der n=1 Tax=Euplotes crassus TaxID=5936 RepID=A0AAD1TZ17_EUPCR|nr:unnamed protein product [Moneuplotes crassus]